MAVNQHFTKTWRVQNSGSCTWITTFYLGFAYGELMGGQTKVPLTSAVATGQTVDLSVSLIAPNKTGKLTGSGLYSTIKAIPLGNPSPS